MRTKLSLAVGFAAGYYFGAKAGRERYVEMRSWLNQAKQSDFVETATDKARAVVDLGVERARDIVDRTTDDSSDSSDRGPGSAASRPGNGTTGAGYSPSR